MGLFDCFDPFQRKADGVGFELMRDFPSGQAKDCKQVSSGFSMRDIEWDTWSCVLGFPVRGMFT